MAKFIKPILPLIMIFFLTFNSNAGTVAGFGGSTEITQILNNVQLMQQYGQQVVAVQNQITQIANQLQMYQNMINNTQSLVGNPFQSAMQTIMQLRNVINQATSLSYTIGSVDTYFTQMNPNYATLFQGNNYATQQQVWRTSVLDHTKATLKASNYTISNMQNEAQLVNQLNNASRSTTGQVAAIQASSSIATQMASMIGELKVITATQAESQGHYILHKEAKEAADEMSVQQLYQYNPASTNPNDNATF